MDRWEYKTLKIATRGFAGGKLDEIEFERELNELGEKGWELVSCFDTNKHHPYNKVSSLTNIPFSRNV